LQPELLRAVDRTGDRLQAGNVAGVGDRSSNCWQNSRTSHNHRNTVWRAAMVAHQLVLLTDV